MKSEKWDRFYLGLARFISSRSKDPNKKVGAVVTENNYVRGIGYNGFPRAIEDSPRRLNNKELKNLIMIHAEINALQCAMGRGDTIYVYPCLPCSQCLGNISQYGITRIVTLPLDPETKWNQPLVMELAKEANIEVTFVNEEDVYVN
jgi:dCMP deaminase